MICSGVPNSTTLPCFHGANVVGVVPGEVDVVQHDDDGAVQFGRSTFEVLHHDYRMLHVQVIQWFIKQDGVGVLRQNHGNVGALALAAGELIKVAAFNSPRSRKSMDREMISSST